MDLISLKIKERRFRELQRAVLESRFDANETLFLERELTQLRAKIYQVQYPTLKARTFAQKATDIASSAETYTYKVYEIVGQTGHRAYKSDDHPKIDVVAREVTGKVRPITGFYEWDINELREASRLGLELSSVKGTAARDFVERGIDATLAYGAIPDTGGSVPDLGCTGLVNNPDVAGVANARVLSGSFWNPASPNPEGMLADLNKMASAARQASKEVFDSDSIILPLTHHDLAVQTPYSEFEGTSVPETFLKNNKNIKSVSPWHLLDNVTTAQGGADRPRALVYTNRADVVEIVVPQEFEVLPPEVRNYKMLNHVHARCGGAKIYYAAGFHYMDFALS